mmetsp:Transcript_10549/g.37441  ORF Transcript_10549/g.37441 Transcript_10549/m.37441 type:complete len:247 (-) Transcript_10549:2221-2961(-)
MRVQKLLVGGLEGGMGERVAPRREGAHQAILVDELDDGVHLAPRPHHGLGRRLGRRQELRLGTQVHIASNLVVVQYNTLHLVPLLELSLKVVVGDQADEVLLAAKVAHHTVVLVARDDAGDRRTDLQAIQISPSLSPLPRQTPSGLCLPPQRPKHLSPRTSVICRLEREPQRPFLALRGRRDLAPHRLAQAQVVAWVHNELVGDLRLGDDAHYASSETHDALVREDPVHVARQAGSHFCRGGVGSS